MKKDDIIGQKLFETCKLSEFYLNLIVNARMSDDDSPFELALAYKQKLYEIVERYDRLLEAASQREQLTLQLNNHHHSQPYSGKPPPAPLPSSRIRSAAVTPTNNRVLNISQQIKVRQEKYLIICLFRFYWSKIADFRINYFHRFIGINKFLVKSLIKAIIFLSNINYKKFEKRLSNLKFLKYL